MVANGQGLLQGWNLLLVRPEPLLIKDIKVQVNKQKLSDVCPARMKHNSDTMTIVPMSSQSCSKPDVVGSSSSTLTLFFVSKVACHLHFSVAQSNSIFCQIYSYMQWNLFCLHLCKLLFRCFYFGHKNIRFQ